jgi:hypothetical protein
MLSYINEVNLSTKKLFFCVNQHGLTKFSKMILAKILKNTKIANAKSLFAVYFNIF